MKKSMFDLGMEILELREKENNVPKDEYFHYHDFEEVMKFHGETKILKLEILNQMTELKNNNSIIVEYCELMDKMQEVKQIGRNFNLPK